MIDDFLYSNPELYETVFPSRHKDELCRRVFEKHLPVPPSSVLDAGCGTGRDLHELSKRCPDCVGFDVTPEMVTFARRRFPTLTLHVGDMRSTRLGRTFDAICALGGSINFALSNEDLVQTIATYGAHAHQGTLLLLEPLNPCDYFGRLHAPATFTVPYGGSTAIGSARYELLAQQQVVERTRTWTVAGGDDRFTDSMRYRVVFPAELAYFLAQGGFEVVEIFETPGNEVYNSPSLYLVAKFGGS